MARLPFWVALLPLVIGVLGYWIYWRGEAAAFRSEVAAHIGAPATAAGFPYRIEAHASDVSVRPDIPGITLSAAAKQLVVNRQPWRTGHVVVAADAPRLEMTVAEFPGLRLAVEAPAMLASLRRPGDRIERLSMQFETAEVWLPFVGGPYAATDFELHLRETSLAADAASPTLPVQAEARIAGTLEQGGVRFGISVPLFATSRSRIVSLAGWADGGTVEVKGAQLLAEGQPLADIDATLAPLPGGRVAVSGTIRSLCPLTVKALFEGRTTPSEYRSRRARTLTLTGDSVAGFAIGEPEGATGGPVRNQEPPCPALRR